MKPSLLLIVLLGALLGCEFPLEDEYNLEISDTPKNNLTIALEELPDTVDVFNNIGVTYSLDVEGYPAIAVFVVVGNKAEYIGYNYNGGFTLSNMTDQIQTKGYLPFEFVVLTTTRTGSLADHSQRELMIFSEKRVLYFDYTPVKMVNLNKVEKNGSVLLSWDKYPEENLVVMWIEKTLTNNGNITTEGIPLHRDSTTYRDDEFLGSEAVYSLVTENSLSDRAQSAKVKVTATPSRIAEFKTVASNQLLLKWNRPHFYNNAVGYQLNRYYMYGTVFYTTSKPSDTTYTLSDFPFGEDLDLFLTTTSRKASNSTIEKTTVWLGEKKPTFKKVIYNKSNDAFFFLNSPYLVREKNGVRDSVNINVDASKASGVSSNGQSIMVSSEAAIIEVSTTSLTTQHSFPNSDNFTSLLAFPTKIVAVNHPPNEYPYFNVYDKSTGAVIQTFPLTDVPGGPSNQVITRIFDTAHPDYFIGDGADVGLFKIASNGTIESSKFAPGRAAVVSEDAQYIYIFDDYYRYKYTFPQFEKVEGAEDVLPIHSSNFLYDTDKRLIAMFYGNTVSIVDMETLAVRKTIKITTQPAHYTLSNGVLFVNVFEGRNYAYDLGL